MKTYHMADILPLLRLPYPPNGRSSYYVPCPCCDSGRHKHLNINLVKDVFRCPRCGFYGGVFDLYAHYTGVRRDDVKNELDRILGDSLDQSHQRKRQSVAPRTPAVLEYPVTDIEIRDDTYRALLGKLSLASDHMQNLQERGLSEDAITANGYRTTPLVGMGALARQLHSEGKYLSGVPGFYRDADGQWIFACEKRGILVPVRDMRGRIQGLQIRLDNVSKRKYRWLSSNERQDGCKAEGWIHIAGELREQVLLIEGPMKADIVHALIGQTVVAVPGVNALVQLEVTLAELMEHGVRKIMTCFDMDMLKNPHVQNGYRELTRLLRNFGLTYGTFLWNPEFNGLDDYVRENLLHCDNRIELPTRNY